MEAIEKAAFQGKGQSRSLLPIRLNERHALLARVVLDKVVLGERGGRCGEQVNEISGREHVFSSEK